MKMWPFPMSNPDGDAGEPLSATQRAAKFGVRFAHLTDEYGSHVCTVAYRPTTSNKNCRMMEVSVAYKHPKDTYVRKAGAELAAQRMLNGESVVMPLKAREHWVTMSNLQRTFVL